MPIPTPSLIRGHLLALAVAMVAGIGATGGAAQVTGSGGLCLPADSLTFTPNRQLRVAEDVGRAYCVLQERELRHRDGSAGPDLLFGLPAASRIRTGLLRGNVSQRGFNSLFSGPLVFLEDLRPAQVPVFQVNALHLLSSTSLDLERVEAMPGGVSHLYGSQGAGGVIHLRTVSALDDPGTRAYLGAGERGVVEGAFRQGVRFSPSAALRVSAHYFQGDEWESRDPVEDALRDRVLETGGTRRELSIGQRDPQVARWGASARLDLRPGADTEVMVSGGSTTALRNVEFTGLGAVQSQDWRLSHGQVQLRRGGLLGQLHGTLSESGDSYLLRTGELVDDGSWRAGGRLQHSLRVGRAGELLYGVDGVRVQPGSGDAPGVLVDHTGHGNPPGIVRDDPVDEVGAFLRGKLGFNREWVISGGVRVDWHSGLEDPVLSPGFELAFNPGDGHTIYGSINRSFTPPTPFQLQLDLLSGNLPMGEMAVPIRARGVPSSGFTFQHDPGICATGLGGYCMRTPFIPGAPRLPARGALLWNPVLFQFAPEQAVPVLAALLDPGSDELATLFKRLDPERLALGESAFLPDAEGPREVERLRPSYFSSLEGGYRGEPRSGLRVHADLFVSQVKDLVGPLRVETPSVFYDPNSVAAFLQRRLLPLVESGRLTAAEFEALVADVTEIMGAIPLGTVTADQQDGAELLLTYRNVGDALLFGGELAVEADVHPSVTLLGFYGHLSTTCLGEGTGSCAGPEQVALNAPAHSGGVAVRFRNAARGLRSELRVAHRGGYPLAAGLVMGPVEGLTTVDLALGARFPRVTGLELGVAVSNALDSAVADFPGGPAPGRLVVLRLGYARP